MFFYTLGPISTLYTTLFFFVLSLFFDTWDFHETSSSPLNC